MMSLPLPSEEKQMDTKCGDESCVPLPIKTHLPRLRQLRAASLESYTRSQNCYTLKYLLMVTMTQRRMIVCQLSFDAYH